ncbi:putative signal peptide protein [Puccinia sorghi]|uniref:Putative signal peptide protein n=1 Tax=Puccinia sorghi TaxID=27349 RepID=A0A0L6VC34_9BASI|nr:putative signal peptide protein [Puccinia sorghi]
MMGRPLMCIITPVCMTVPNPAFCVVARGWNGSCLQPMTHMVGWQALGNPSHATTTSSCRGKPSNGLILCTNILAQAVNSRSGQPADRGGIGKSTGKRSGLGRRDRHDSGLASLPFSILRTNPELFFFSLSSNSTPYPHSRSNFSPFLHCRISSTRYLHLRLSLEVRYLSYQDVVCSLLPMLLRYLPVRLTGRCTRHAARLRANTSFWDPLLHRRAPRPSFPSKSGRQSLLLMRLQPPTPPTPNLVRYFLGDYFCHHGHGTFSQVKPRLHGRGLSSSTRRWYSSHIPSIGFAQSGLSQHGSRVQRNRLSECGWLSKCGYRSKCRFRASCGCLCQHDCLTQRGGSPSAPAAIIHATPPAATATTTTSVAVAPASSTAVHPPAVVPVETFSSADPADASNARNAANSSAAANTTPASSIAPSLTLSAPVSLLAALVFIFFPCFFELLFSLLKIEATELSIFLLSMCSVSCISDIYGIQNPDLKSYITAEFIFLAGDFQQKGFHESISRGPSIDPPLDDM